MHLVDGPIILLDFHLMKLVRHARFGYNYLSLHFLLARQTFLCKECQGDIFTYSNSFLFLFSFLFVSS